MSGSSKSRSVPPVPEPHPLPSEGGSFIRQPDGTLVREESADQGVRVPPKPNAPSEEH